MIVCKWSMMTCVITHKIGLAIVAQVVSLRMPQSNRLWYRRMTFSTSVCDY